MLPEEQKDILQKYSPAILTGAGVSSMIASHMIMERRRNVMSRYQITLTISYLNYLKTVYANLHWWQIPSKVRIKRKIKEQKLELNKLYGES